MAIGSCYNCTNCDFLTEPTSCTKGGDIPVYYSETYDMYLVSILDFDCQYFNNKRPLVKRKRKRNLYQEAYNQALDDFNNLIKDYVLNNGTIPNHFNSDLIAEKLKKGGKNEDNN